MTAAPGLGRRTAVSKATSAPSCHGDSGGVTVAGAPVVALIGAPNAGKSTLFNSLTGSSRSVGNWPGTTVEVGRGTWRVPRSDVTGLTDLTVLDLPGAYSLDAQSPDETLTRDLLLVNDIADQPDLTVVVADGAHLSRSLYLLAQLREQGRRLVLALTMLDVAARRGVAVDVTALSQSIGVPVVALDPRRRAGASELADAVHAALAAEVPPARPVPPLPEPVDPLDAADERFGWIEQVLAGEAVRTAPAPPTWSDRLDRVATTPVIGPLLFLAVMWCVFELTTTVAAPLQDALGTLFSGPVSSAGRWLFGAIGLGGSWGEQLVVNGLIAGVGMLLTFAPLMAIMFALLALLEDSGYLARAAVVTDRLMRTLGLPGRAFLPMVVGFGCNVPAISATRILPNARHRILTALLIPFTSCSARLTVYVLVAATFFPSHAGTVVFGMYVASVVVIVAVGLALKSTLWRTVGAEALVLDLPAYQRPSPRLVFGQMWMRLRSFLRTATGPIVATVIVVWFLQAVPVTGGGSFGTSVPADSAFAAVSRAIAPVFSWAGFADWHTVGALVVGFVAKEAVISSWAQTYAAADPSTGLSPGELQGHITSAFSMSSGGATAAAVFAFLFFLLAYTPCVATVAAQRREIGVRWTLFGIGLQLSVAWTLAVAVFQIGRLL